VGKRFCSHDNLTDATSCAHTAAAESLKGSLETQTKRIEPMPWLKLTEATTPTRPIWLNSDQFVQMVAGPERGTRLYTSTIVWTNTYKTAVGDIPEFFYVDVIETPAEIMWALRKRTDHGAEEHQEEKAPMTSSLGLTGL
jgi:hypothetical protein